MTEKKKLRIGDFIISKLKIPKKEIYKFLNMQAYLDEKIGELATQENLLSEEELDRILKYQQLNKVTFGNAAISLGFLRSFQLKYLLDIQAQKKQRLGDLLVQEGVITQERLFSLLDEFYAANKTHFKILALTNATIFKKVSDVVKNYHYDITNCERKEKLVTTIKRVEPHLILLDTDEGEIRGIIKEIKEAKASAHIKIALLSPEKEKLKVISGYEQGIDYLLPLPFEGKDLINIIIDSEIQHSRRRKQRVLVVDDSKIVRLSVTKELHESGFQTITACNGQEAVELAALEKPDLITMDINMPVMNGYKACETIKTCPDTSNIPIIILTSNNTQEERERGFDVGAIEYFTKPFTKGYLSNYIHHLLSSESASREEKILVADDSLLCRNIFASVLDKYGFEYEMVKNGQELFDLLKKGFLPSTILLDHQMPIVNGLEACKRLKEDERYRHIPVIMVTGSTEKDNVLKGLKSGADDYLTKPFDGDELIARIETHTRSFTLLEKLKEQNRLLSESERALIDSQAYSRNIIDSSMDMIITSDNEGKIVEFNNAAENTYGYSRNEVVGKDLSVLFVYHEDEVVKHALKASGTFFGEVHNVRKDGSIFPSSISASYLKDAMGKVILGTMGVSRDITLLRQAEEDLREAKENAERYAKQAEEANKAKSSFLASMSHEIRTPLNAIIGMADFLNDTKLSIEQEEYVGTFKNAGESLLALINDILDLSKIEAGRLELEKVSFDLQELIEKTTEIMAMKAHEKGLEIFSQIKGNVPTQLMGDPNRLRQVFVNLLGNAIKFTAKGQVGIEVHAVTSKEGSHSLKFSISDTGIGIPDDKKETVFDIFSQADTSTSRQFGGTGLGLSISRQLVAMMQGRIWIEGDFGKGSTFCFTADFGEVQYADRRKEERHENALKGIHALLIEKNESNRIVMKEIMESFGMSVVLLEENSALDEIKKARKTSHPFDIILLNSSDSSTMESIKLVRGIFDKVIMLLTCDNRVKQKEILEKYGVRESILKPIKRGMLYKMLLLNLKRQSPKKYEWVKVQKERGHSAGNIVKTSNVLRILLAEDNKVNQTIAVKTIQLKGHEAVIAENGQVAVEKHAEGNFDLILMDVNMPEMDGYDATLAIREKEKSTGEHIPIIAMTAMAFAEDRQKCLEVGMDDFLSKPLRREEFLNKIESYAVAKGVKEGQPEEMPASETPEELPQEKTPSTIFTDTAFHYNEALSTAMNDVPFLKEMMAIFIAEATPDMEKVRVAIEEKDNAALRKSAHKLKGSASTLAAKEVVELTFTLENMGKKEQVEESGETFDKLVKAMKHLEDLFTSFI